MYDFPVGESVVIIGGPYHDPRGPRIGATGTVVVNDSDHTVGVYWDEAFPYGHNCGGRCPVHHGWYVSTEEVEPLESDFTESDCDMFADLLL